MANQQSHNQGGQSSLQEQNVAFAYWVNKEVMNLWCSARMITLFVEADSLEKCCQQWQLTHTGKHRGTSHLLQDRKVYPFSRPLIKGYTNQETFSGRW